MATAMYWQRGEAIDFTNTTKEKIAANTVIVIGSKIGIAGSDMLPGEKGSLHVEGVFVFTKETGELKMGDALFYDDKKGTVSKTGTNPAGYAAENAAADAIRVAVKING